MAMSVVGILKSAKVGQGCGGALPRFGRVDVVCYTGGGECSRRRHEGDDEGAGRESRLREGEKGPGQS